MSEDKKADVGYGKPPKATRFKPGQSGNPKGRPPRKKSVATQIEEILRETVTVRENGREVKMARQLVMLKALAGKAVKGDMKAIEFLLRLRETHRDDATDVIDPEKLGAEDQALLADYVRRHGDDRPDNEG